MFAAGQHCHDDAILIQEIDGRPASATREPLMTFSFCRSVRGVVQTTLLLAGMSLAVSSDLRGEESPEEQPQQVDETGNDASPN